MEIIFGRGSGLEKQNREKSQDHAKYMEVWEDLVSIKDLFLSIIIIAFFTMAGYFIAPDREPLPLFLGLTGSLLGFIICSFIFKPKRTIDIKDEG